MPSAKSRPSTSRAGRPITCLRSSPVSSNDPRPQWMSRPSWSQAKKAAFGAGGYSSSSSNTNANPHFEHPRASRRKPRWRSDAVWRVPQFGQMNRCAMAARKCSSRTEAVLNERGRRKTEVRPRRRSRHAPARRAFEEAALQQVGLVDVLNRVGLLPDRHGERREADGTAAELLADRREDLAVEAVEAELVDVEHGQRRVGRARGDNPAVAHL